MIANARRAGSRYIMYVHTYLNHCDARVVIWYMDVGSFFTLLGSWKGCAAMLPVCVIIEPCGSVEMLRATCWFNIHVASTCSKGLPDIINFNTVG